MPTDLPEEPGRSPDDDPRRDVVASIGQRALARVIDWLIVTTVLMAIAVSGVERDGDTVELPVWVIISWLAVWLAYEGIMLARYGYTLGKMAVRIKVVDVRDGGLPSTGRALARTGVAVAVAAAGGQSVGLFALIAVYFSAALDRHTHRGLPDRVAGTAVVRSDVTVLSDPEPA